MELAYKVKLEKEHYERILRVIDARGEEIEKWKKLSEKAKQEGTKLRLTVVLDVVLVV